MDATATDAKIYRWSEITEDHPIALLARKQIWADRILVAQVHLDKGCYVAPHSHESEQVAYMVSGRAHWWIGEEGSAKRHELFTTGGEVLHLPSNIVHSVEALEDCEIIDLLSPPGKMGIDSQGAH